MDRGDPCRKERYHPSHPNLDPADGPATIGRGGGSTCGTGSTGGIGGTGSTSGTDGNGNSNNCTVLLRHLLRQVAGSQVVVPHVLFAGHQV